MKRLLVLTLAITTMLVLGGCSGPHYSNPERYYGLGNHYCHCPIDVRTADNHAQPCRCGTSKGTP